MRPCLPHCWEKMTCGKSSQYFVGGAECVQDMVRKKQSAERAITEADLAKEYAREIVSYFGQ